jgi:hypothetical protein
MKTYTINKYEVLLDTKKMVGLEVNTQETKHMVMSHHQNSGLNHNIKTYNKSFGNVVNIKYLGTTVNKSILHS